MKKICSIFSKVTQKINFKNILILYVIIFFLWNLPTFISKLNEYGVYALFTTIGFILIAIFCVCIIILIIFKMPDKITYFKKQIKIYGIKKVESINRIYMMISTNIQKYIILIYHGCLNTTQSS